MIIKSALSKKLEINLINCKIDESVLYERNIENSDFVKPII